MRDDTLTMPSPVQPLRTDAAEPQLDWRSVPRSREPVSGLEHDEGMPAAPPTSGPLGSLLYIGLVGLIAVAIVGVFFGAGFRLLAPLKEPVAASAPPDPKPPLSHGDILRARRVGSPVSPELAVPGSGAVASLPAAIEAPPQREVPAAAATSNPPSQPPSAPVLQPGSAATSPPPVPSASLPEVSKSEAAFSGGGKRHASPSRSNHHTRTASRHPHGQSAHSGQALVAPQPYQTRSFDQLVTRLTTGQPRSDAPSLTPPHPQQPDPFAQR
jgi:hypothetical protein